MSFAKTALIYNPRSHTVTRRGSVLAEAATRMPDAPLICIDDFELLPKRIQELAQSGVRTLCVEGGDGTVLAVLTAALDPKSGFAVPPDFAILPGGSTNLAYDILGLHATTADTVIARLQDPALERVTQRALQITPNGGGGGTPAPHVGFLLSTGSLARAMRYVQREFHGDGPRGVAAVAAAILRFVLTPRKYHDSDGAPLLRPSAYHLVADTISLDGPHTLSLATTLPKLSLGLQPFWGTGAGAIALTHVAWPVRGLRRTLIQILLGRRSEEFAKNGFTSYRCDHYTLTHGDTLMLDGEILPIPDQGRLMVTTTAPLVFLR